MLNNKEIRRLAHCSGRNYPIKILKNSLQQPTLKGSPHKSTYHNGRWRTISRSTHEIVVGDIYLLLQEEPLCLMPTFAQHDYLLEHGYDQKVVSQLLQKGEIF
jgi:hypothetical protein